MILRTERDILRAYRVYKCRYYLQKNIEESNEYIDSLLILAIYVALYDGITLSELQKVIPLSKTLIRDLVRKSVYNYGIFQYNKDLVIGHRGYIDNGSKGVITLSDEFDTVVKVNTENLKVSRKTLYVFGRMLSNGTSHVNILRNNLGTEIGTKGVLQHLYSIWLALLDNKLFYQSTCAKNLEEIGYLKTVNESMLLNKNAVMLNKEPYFELSTV